MSEITARQATMLLKRKLRQMGFESPKIKSSLLDFEDLARRKRVFSELLNPKWCDLNQIQRQEIERFARANGFYIQTFPCFSFKRDVLI